MENTPIKFAEGMSFKARHDKAPETVRGSIYFKARDFIKFLEENMDEKGWVHTKMMKSTKTGGIYFILDTWKPTPKDDETGEVIPKELTGQDKINQDSANRAGMGTLSDEELESLSQIPF